MCCNGLKLTQIWFTVSKTLRSLIDKHAPQKQRWISIRPKAPWYTSEMTEQKRIRRNLERKWRPTRSQSDRQHYVK